MDLTRMSREELIFEARRLGVGSPEAMSRGKLIRTIAIAKARISVPRLAVKMAGSLLGGVVSLARGALGPPAHALGRASHASTPPARPSPSPSRHVTAPPSATPYPSEHRTATSATTERSAPRASQPSSSSGSPPDGKEPLREPIETITMARLLAEQGHFGRASGILERLLARHPDDADLRVEAEDVRARAAGHQPVEMVCLVVDGATLLVSWDVREPAIARARRVLGTTGELAVRVVITAPDAVRIVDSHTRERREVAAAGEWLLEDLTPGTRATASVGLMVGERFVSIAHAPPSRLP